MKDIDINEIVSSIQQELISLNSNVQLSGQKTRAGIARGCLRLINILTMWTNMYSECFEYILMHQFNNIQNIHNSLVASQTNFTGIRIPGDITGDIDVTVVTADLRRLIERLQLVQLNPKERTLLREKNIKFRLQKLSSMINDASFQLKSLLSNIDQRNQRTKDKSYIDQLMSIVTKINENPGFFEYALMSKLDDLRALLPNSPQDFVRLDNLESKDNVSHVLTEHLIPLIDRLKQEKDLILWLPAISMKYGLKQYNIPPEVLKHCMSFIYHHSNNIFDCLEVIEKETQNRRLSIPFFSSIARRSNDAAEFEQYTAIHHGGDKRKAGAMVKFR